MNKWAHLEHQLGECWVNTDKSITYINIPIEANYELINQIKFYGN